MLKRTPSEEMAGAISRISELFSESVRKSLPQGWQEWSHIRLSDLQKIQTAINALSAPNAAEIFLHNLVQGFVYNNLFGKTQKDSHISRRSLMGNLLDDIGLNGFGGPIIKHARGKMRRHEHGLIRDREQVFGYLQLIRVALRDTVRRVKREIEKPLLKVDNEHENVVRFSENYLEDTSLLLLTTALERVEAEVREGLGDVRSNYSTLEGVSRLLVLTPGAAEPQSVLELGAPPEDIDPLAHSGKFIGLAHLHAMELPVPRALSIAPHVDVETAWPAVVRFMNQVEQNSGPSQWAVRSGSFVSMPGQMDTIIGAGLSEDFARTGWPWLRRYVGFIQAYAQHVEGERLDLPAVAFPLTEGADSILAQCHRMYFDQVGKPFPQERDRQVLQMMGSVYDSWGKALAFRKLNAVPDEWGTGVVLQRVMWADEENAGAGMLLIGADGGIERGEIVVGEMGEALVSGRATPISWHDLPARISDQMLVGAQKIGERLGDAEAEVVYRDNTVWWLQVRRRISEVEIHGKFVGSEPVEGSAAFTLAQVNKLLAWGKPVIFIKHEVCQEDYEAITKSVGIITEIGGLCSHPGINCIEQRKTAAIGVGEHISVLCKGLVPERPFVVFRGNTRIHFGTRIRIIPREEQIVIL